MDDQYGLDEWKVISSCLGYYSLKNNLNPLKNSRRRSLKRGSGQFNSKEINEVTEMAYKRLKLRNPNVHWNKDTINMYVQCGCKFQKHQNYKSNQKVMRLLLSAEFPQFNKKK